MNGRLPRFALVNPLTLVGKELRTILHQRGTLFSHIELLDSTGDAEGVLTDVADEAAVVRPVESNSFDDVDVIFVCGTGSDDNAWLEWAGASRVIDLTGRVSGGTHVVVGVNDEIVGSQSVLSSPHPATVLLAHLFKVLQSQGTVVDASATILQPASLYDQPGIDELFNQTIAALNMQAQPREIFDRQLAFNQYPAPEADATEQLIATQLREVLGTPPPTAISLVQSTAFHGLSITLFARFETPIDLDALRAGLGRGAEIELREGEDAASTIDSAGIDEILIGRIQEHGAIPGAISLWAVVDNLRRGSALNAVLLAESLTSTIAN